MGTRYLRRGDVVPEEVTIDVGESAKIRMVRVHSELEIATNLDE